ncbi:T9SS type A sorting domain-containing protein [Flavobacterium sp. UW10123]|uniref:DUF7619 domain-containing protein n=1 Tax=Flavobacterium sp. UW10123 TaxID=3230800 RepID=UPI0033997920
MKIPLMKKLYFLIIALCFFNGLSAQVINFPNAQFKSDLLSGNYTRDINGSYLSVDSNGDNEIDISEALKVYEIADENHFITDVTGIENFTNLVALKIQGNKITNLDASNLKKLKYLDCSSNMLKTLNISGLNDLSYLKCSTNGLKNLDLTGLKSLTNLYCSQNAIKNLLIKDLPLLKLVECVGLGFGDTSTTSTLVLDNLPNLINLDCTSGNISELKMTGIGKLEYLTCKGNKLTTLDASEMYSAKSIIVSNNYELTSLFVKNGVDENVSFGNNNFNSELKYICADESQIKSLQYNIDRNMSYLSGKCLIGSYCSFKPGGILYTVKGNQKWDINNNGCDIQDPIFPYLKINISNGNISEDFIADNSGNYSIYAQAGNHTIKPVILENPSFFIVSPNNMNVNFPIDNNPFIQDFCISSNGNHSDIEIVMLPIQDARPGFDAKYKIIFKNKGNTIEEGSVNLNFDDSKLEYVSSDVFFTSKALNKIVWNFNNLQPFESRQIIVSLKVNRPTETPPVNIGDIISYTVKVESDSNDETPLDNTFTLNQTVVGSYDPNDKTCLEGSIVTSSLIGEYVHYMIRFENTGTYSAQNIVVKDMIDLSKFDISTLVPTSSSHSFITKISEGNKVEFIFENINLPFDDANNDGYIAFKIKTKPTLVLGDSFTNEANIYFDYNFPILTNKATSTFKTLGIQDFEFSKYLKLYPNPTNHFLNISQNQNIEIQSFEIYDILGQLVIAIPNAKTTSNIDISKLRTGNYFIKAKSDKGSSSMKFIKN